MKITCTECSTELTGDNLYIKNNSWVCEEHKVPGAPSVFGPYKSYEQQLSDRMEKK